MADVAAARGTSGLKVVSTFSGCGGSCLGFELAGFEVIWANEFVEAARETYAANHPGTALDGRDIRTVTAEDILRETGLKRGELDVLNGSPPCASFSTSGKREKGWGKVKKYSDTEQRTDDLFFEFSRLLEGLQPKAFVAENVAGLTMGAAIGYFKQIMRALEACGYVVRCRVLDAQWLGVPQTRRRAIIVGVRKDLGVDPPFPTPLLYNYSLREACPWITRAVHDTSGAFGKGEFTDEPCPAITVGVNSVNSPHFKFVGAGMHEDDAPHFEQYAIGEEWDRLELGEVSKRYLNLVKVHPDRPCNAITATGGNSAGVAGPTHPFVKRKFTIRELKRICSFPDDFVLTGNYSQQWERLGRAVPPLMMRAVAEALRDGVFRKRS